MSLEISSFQAQGNPNRDNLAIVKTTTRSLWLNLSSFFALTYSIDHVLARQPSTNSELIIVDFSDNPTHIWLEQDWGEPRVHCHCQMKVRYIYRPLYINWDYILFISIPPLSPLQQSLHSSPPPPSFSKVRRPWYSSCEVSGVGCPTPIRNSMIPVCMLTSLLSSPCQ